MESLIIKTVCALLYLAWRAVLLVGLFFIFVGNLEGAICVVIGGWFGCRLVAGAACALLDDAGKK
jgi:hypothetical protein